MHKSLLYLMLCPTLLFAAAMEEYLPVPLAETPYATQPQTSLTSTIEAFLEKKQNEQLATWLEEQHTQHQPFTHAQLAPIAAHLKQQKTTLITEYNEAHTAHCKNYEMLAETLRQLNGKPKIESEYKDATAFEQAFAQAQKNGQIAAFISDLPHITQEQYHRMFDYLNAELSASHQPYLHLEKSMPQKQQTLARIETILTHYARERMADRCCLHHSEHPCTQYSLCATDGIDSCGVCSKEDFNLCCTPCRFLCGIPTAWLANCFRYCCCPLSDPLN